MNISADVLSATCFYAAVGARDRHRPARCLWLAIGFPVGYVTQGSPAQLGADYVPLWATLFIATTCGSVPVITAVVCVGHLRTRARERRAIASDPSAPPPRSLD